MRRADRLFQIVSLLRRRRFVTAAWLAERLEVSERTIYRDVRDLMGSGVPIEGEAGVGYRLGKDFDLPPMMFNVDEIQALVLGARMVETWGDDELRRAARSVLDKTEAMLPPKLRSQIDDTALFARSFRVPERVREWLGPIRRAVGERRKLELRYRDVDDHASARVVRPLGLYFWGTTWTLGAWCELREDFRNFRLDRLDAVDAQAEHFELAPPVTLEDYVEAMRRDAGASA
ncbi:Bifunctional ligase/repressor BirA [Enhygromyxa salina]|uniref:Bifunctional ligase/repressor BirA n=1 Tax=Enhygromyxa salina TaxID=215803 RepID=A0A2S9XDF5_9BACT|nr:YafY family protein [Enhygromyxa salina]PRP90896.1 Bifunctional ligase/repressor BirA [Enhygromyxa salina]